MYKTVLFFIGLIILLSIIDCNQFTKEKLDKDKAEEARLILNLSFEDVSFAEDCTCEGEGFLSHQYGLLPYSVKFKMNLGDMNPKRVETTHKDQHLIYLVATDLLDKIETEIPVPEPTPNQVKERNDPRLVLGPLLQESELWELGQEFPRQANFHAIYLPLSHKLETAGNERLMMVRGALIDLVYFCGGRNDTSYDPINVE